MEIKKVWSVNCLSCWKPSNIGASLGGGIELCESSSCLGGLIISWILKGFWLYTCFCWMMDIWYECEVLLLLNGVGCCCVCLLLWNLKFCFWMFCGDVAVSDGTGGLIAMVWNSFFQGCVGFTCVFSCPVVGWAFPVVDYISFLSIWNWIFWIHE